MSISVQSVQISSVVSSPCEWFSCTLNNHKSSGRSAAAAPLLDYSDHERLGMSVRVIETAGKKIGGALVNLDLPGCWWPDCYLCQCEAAGGAKGGSHTRAEPLTAASA